MRITCPSCDATYEVPGTLLGVAPRKVRCARCAFEWLPEPAAAAQAAAAQAAAAQAAAAQAAAEPIAPEPIAPEPIAPEPIAPEPPPRLRPEPRAERPLRAEPLPPLPLPERGPPPSLRARSRPAPVLASLAVLAISMVVLISIGWAAYAWRAEVMHAWPPSQRVFAALGLA